MAVSKAVEVPTKFVIEYFTDDKKLESRWHFNHDKTKNGPVLVEEFIFPPKERKKRTTKKKL